MVKILSVTQEKQHAEKLEHKVNGKWRDAKMYRERDQGENTIFNFFLFFIMLIYMEACNLYCRVPKDTAEKNIILAILKKIPCQNHRGYCKYVDLL